MRRIAIVIPVYNEGRALQETLPKIATSILSIDSSYKIFYVDDGSTDNSLEVLWSLKRSYLYPHVEILSLTSNEGYGEALRFGAERAHQEGFWAVVFMDSDLTNPPSEIPLMVARLENSELVKASRYVVGADASEVPWVRRVYSIVGNRILQILFRTSTRDITNGFRAWRLENYLSFRCERKGFDSIVEEFYYARTLNFRITECPSTLYSRGDQLRASSASYSLRVLRNYLSPGLAFFRKR